MDVPKITNKEIAARMQVSPPAVTEMIKRMQSENLILKDKKKGYLLTDIGLTLVSELYRKHRLIEVFLVHHLDYTSDQIHEEAEVLEHTVSDFFVERLESMLGFPKLALTVVPFLLKESCWLKSTTYHYQKPKKLEPISWLGFTTVLIS